MYFEIYRSGNLIKRGDEILNDTLEWDNELMYTPSMQIELPVYYHDYITGRDEMKIFINEKCFWGIVQGLTEDKAEEVLRVDLEHILKEWTYRQIAVNNAIKDSKVNIVYKGSKTVSNGGANISASDFNMLVNEVDSFTSEQYIKRSGASAWSDNGEKLTVSSVDSSAVQAKPGSYLVGFTSGDANVAVTATVKQAEGAVSVQKDKVKVSATPFEVTVDEVGTLSDAEWIKRALAIAWRTS